MQLNTNCPHWWKQLFRWFCSTMNLNATLVLPVLGEYLIFVNIIHYWFQFFKHFRIREPPVPVLWGKIWTKEFEYKHCSVEWVFDFANNHQFQFFKHFRTASSGSLENNSGSKNCQFLLFQKLQPTSGFHKRTVKELVVMNQTSWLAFSNMQNWQLFDSQIPVRPRFEGSLILQEKTIAHVA